MQSSEKRESPSSATVLSLALAIGLFPYSVSRRTSWASSPVSAQRSRARYGSERFVKTSL